MAVSLIQSDITLMRKRYDEALKMQGIPAKYQFPNLPTSNNQGESVVDSYSEYIDTNIFFEGNPKVKTFKRYGWVVENDENLPFLIHCSFNLPNLQKDCAFTLSGQYTGLPDRVFRVTELSYDLQAADHIVCKEIPIYEKQTVGKTDHEIAMQYNKSNYYLKPSTDYTGKEYVTQTELGKPVPKEEVRYTSSNAWIGGDR